MRNSQRTKAAMYSPRLDPITVLGCVRVCIPDHGPVCEDLLRSLTTEIDAILLEVKRAESRRYEEMEHVC